VKDRGLPLANSGAARLKADRAAREEAEVVVDRWNRRMALRHAVVAENPGGAARRSASAIFSVWDATRAGPSIYVPHRLASVGTVVLGLRCSWCLGSVPKAARAVRPTASQAPRRRSMKTFGDGRNRHHLRNSVV
jgi:hypothetical protein